MRSPLPKSFLRSQKLTLTFSIILLVAFVAITSLIVRQRSQPVIQPTNYSQLYLIADSQAAISLNIQGDTLTVLRRDGSLLQAVVTNQAAQQSVIEAFRKQNIPIEFKPSDAGLATTALNWVTPMARHTGAERELLRRREETYRKAQQRRPQRWSRDIRNCSPAPAVTLNPRKKNNDVAAAA